MKKDSPLRLILLVVVLAALAVSAIVFRDEVRQGAVEAVDRVRGLGPWGPVVLAAVYIVATVLFIPGSLLTLGAGAAFGPVVGTITVSVGSTLGASAAFLVGRFLRDWVEARVARHPKFRAIDQAVAEQGFKIVLLTRLSPVFPFTLLNYAFGLTKVRFRDYLLASWIGMLPGTVMYVYLGSVVKDVAELVSGKHERTVGEQVLFYGGLVAAVLVAVFVARVARQALKQAIRDPAPAETAPARTPP